LLFVLFDVELILLLPWLVFGKVSGVCGLFSVCLFFFILGLGFIYEWCVGALRWFFKEII
jgi:NADH-quinone oxidoreductase subunit A